MRKKIAWEWLRVSDGRTVSPPHSSAEILTPKVMLLGDGAFEGD